MSQCTATAKSTGEQCQRDAIKGGNVCYVHGGATSQAQKKAQERLDEMADATTADIQQDIEDLQDEYEAADDPDEKLAILAELRKLWKIVLDRTGHGPTEQREHNVDMDADHTFDAAEGVSATFVTYSAADDAAPEEAADVDD